MERELNQIKPAEAARTIGLRPPAARKILILGLNYLPESTSIGPYTADLAEYLRDQGHHVRVVTGFPTAPQWKVWEGYRGRMFQREVLNGISVLRTYLYVPADPRKALKRILFDSSFAVSSMAGLFWGFRPDLVVVISPPLQLAVTGWIFGVLSGAKMFFHIKDLVPDAAVAVGALRAGSRALKWGKALERWAYRRSAGIGVICEGMRRNLLAKGVPPDKVSVIPDYIDLKFIQPGPRDNAFRSRFNIPAEEFLVSYSGSISGKQGLETFVQAAKDFEGDSGVTCCLIGEGSYLADLKKTASDLSLRRLMFVPFQPRDTLSEQLSAADVLVITQRKSVTDVVFPGKLLYYMASGTAILASVSEDSETARFIRENRVGMVVPPEDPASLSGAIRWLKANPEQTLEFGRNGRRISQAQFDRSIVLHRFAARLEQCCASDSGPQHSSQAVAFQSADNANSFEVPREES